MLVETKPCPFCGMKPDLTDPDTLHPTGTYWREVDGVRYYVRHKDRKLGDNPSWVFNCVETAGGCGVEMHDDVLDGVIAKWNRRLE